MCIKQWSIDYKNIINWVREVVSTMGSTHLFKILPVVESYGIFYHNTVFYRRYKLKKQIASKAHEKTWGPQNSYVKAKTDAVYRWCSFIFATFKIKEGGHLRFFSDIFTIDAKVQLRYSESFVLKHSLTQDQQSKIDFLIKWASWRSSTPINRDIAMSCR